MNGLGASQESAILFFEPDRSVRPGPGTFCRFLGILFGGLAKLMPNGPKNDSITQDVQSYWERASCGTDSTSQPKFSVEYFEEIEEFRYTHEPFIHQFAQFTRWHGKRILEVGVGAGTDFLQFARAGARCHGVDLTDEAISNVKERLRLYGFSADSLQTTNAEQLPYGDNEFDLVYSWGVIHHAENMERILYEIIRVTRPNGQIKIMVYNIRSLHAWYLFFRYALIRGKVLNGRRWAIWHYQESIGTKAYSPRYMKQLLNELNVSEMQLSYWDQHIRRGARFEKLRRGLQRISPLKNRWYMAIQFRKSCEGN